MILFEKEENQKNRLKCKAKSLKTLIKIEEKLKNIITKIEKGTILHYVSKADFSTHDIIAHLCKIMGGNVDVYAATWSVSNEAVNKLIKSQEIGDIKSLNFLLDWRIKVRRPEAHKFLEFNANKIKLSSCHAKVTVLKNEQYSITILGSSNFTNNPRIEAGIIQENDEISKFHKNWIEEELKNAKPFGD